MPPIAPASAEIAHAVDGASEAVYRSTRTRKVWRRRDAPQRRPALEAARNECAECAPQLRSWIGMVAWHNISAEDEIAMKRVMAKLRYERRQIDKMLA